MSTWNRLSKVNQALFPQFESLKHGKLAKVYNLLRDYKAVAVSSVKYAREKPIKFVSLLTTLGLGSYASSRSPDMKSYQDNLIASSNRLLQVSELIRNKDSNSQIRELVVCLNQNKLKCNNFGLFSIVLKSEFGAECDSVDKNCYYIQSRWINIKDRIVDVGFLDRWIFLEKAMIDYDVNDDEFVNL